MVMKGNDIHLKATHQEPDKSICTISYPGSCSPNPRHRKLWSLRMGIDDGSAHGERIIEPSSILNLNLNPKSSAPS